MSSHDVRAARRALRESERAHSTLLANLPGVAYRCLNQPGWPMQFLSQGCLEVTGYTPEALMIGGEKDFGDILHPEDRARVWDEVQQAINAGQPFTLQYRIHTADGGERVVWERGRAVYDELDRLVSLEGFIQDITERVELEARMLEAQKLEAVGQLAGGVVHDINNMLMVIRAFMDAAPSPGEGATHEWREPALQAVDRGTALTRQLLTIARQQPSERSELELGALIDGFVALVGPLLGKAVQLELVRAPEPLWVQGDRIQLEQVLMNLAINARDAMPDGGRLVIRARADAEAALAIVEVEDDGAGIDPALQDRVFTPYFTTKAPERGTGLGLFTVKSIVQQHGGVVDLVSAPGRGCCFSIQLPMVRR